MIYFITYIISAIFCEVGFRERRRVLSFVFLGLAIVIPAFIAGARDVTIGTDRLVYGDSLFNDVCKSSSLLKLESRWEGWVEQGFIYFNYLVSMVTKTYFGYYFILSLTENLFVVLSLKELRISKYAGLSYMCFLFLFFQPAMNMIRQALALSVLLYASMCLFNKKRILAVTLFAIAFSLHHSSVVFLTFPLLLYFANKYQSLKVYFLMGVVVLCLCAVAGKMISLFAPFLDIEAGRYDRYFTASGGKYLNFTELSFALLLVPPAISLFRMKSLLQRLFVAIVLINVPLSQVSCVGGTYVSRVTTYFMWMLIPFFAFVSDLPPRRKIWFLLSLLYAVGYWYYHYIYLGWNQTYPYLWQEGFGF